jgi:Flp pilus assembly protein TadG
MIMFGKAESSWLGRFVRCQSGTTAIIFSLSAVAVLVVAGGAMDWVRSFSTQATLQSALDGAVLAGIENSLQTSYQIDAASKYFKANAGTLADTAEVKFKRQNDRLVGNATISVNTTLLKLAGINKLDVGAVSAATAAPVLERICVMAMHPTRKHTLELKGAVSIVAPDCILYGNSNNTDDVIDPHTVQNFVTARAVLTIGGGHHELQNVTPAPQFGSAQVADPLASMAIPAGGACQYNNTVISGGTTTLSEGVYCGGLTIKAGATVTLNGTYTIRGGKLSIASSTVQGSDVTIVLADNTASLNWSDSTIMIAAKKSGPYKGLAIMGVRQDTNNFLVNSTIDVHGAVYMPNGAFDWTNTGTPPVTAKWTAWVVDGFSWDGSGTIRMNFDVANSDIPYPNGLIAVPFPGTPRLIQ